MGAGPVFRVLGSLALGVAGSEAPFERSRRARRILAALLVDRGRLVTADRLADTVWGAAPPLDPRAATHNLISRLRALIGDVPGVELLTRPSGYVLDASRAAVDACRFEDLLRAARTAGDPRESLELADTALALWRGPAYAEFADEDFARAEATRLSALRQAAEDTRIEGMLALGHHDQATGLLERVIADDPLAERPRVQLMTALYGAGRVAEALASYRAYRELVRDELGLEPGPALSDLEGRILRRDVTLRPPAPPASPAGTPPPRVRHPAAPSPPPFPPQVHPPDGVLTAGPARTSLIGRDGDLAAISDLLANRRLLTLVGPGGVGKTRLAMRLAGLLADRYPDGVIVCELSALSDGTQVAELVAAQAGIMPGSDGRPLLRPVAALASRRSLLILDNCEHVVDSVVGVVDGLLEAPAITILATSREPLGVPDEQVWRVDPLHVPAGEDFDAPSVRLFVERARSVEPSFEPTGELVELCRRLDGLPLAIELAAARMSGTTVGEILRRLDDQPQIVGGGPRTVTPRHRSLGAVVDWSYDLLDDEQKAVFDRLAVFPDAFSLDAATAIAGTSFAPHELVTTVLDLVDRSLVTHTVRAGASRYSQLDTLRRYGREHLRGQGALAELRARHAGWYRDLAEELGGDLGAGRTGWIRRLDDELANLRAAHEWFAARSDVPGLLRMTEALHHYALWSLNPEVFDWARATVALAGDDTSDPLLSVAYATVAHGCWLAGDPGQSREYAELAIAVAGEHPVGRYGRVALAHALVSVDGADEARAELYRDAAALAGRAGVRSHEVYALILHAGCLLRMGRTDEGERLVRRMLREARRLGLADLEAKARLCVADMSIVADPPGALSGYWDVAEINARQGNRYGEFQALVSAAFAEMLYGDTGCAVTVFASLLERWTGLLRDMALSCLLQGVVILLTEAARYRDAATLSGAISAGSPMLVFTVDENVTQRFAATMRRLGDLLDAGELEALREAGRATPREEVYPLALAALRSAVVVAPGG